MESTKLIQNIDLKVARKITINQAKQYGILPLYEENKETFVVVIEESKDGDALLKFLFENRIVYIKKGRDEVINLIDIILDFDYENMEEKIFKDAILNKASDIHYEPSKDSLNVRLRINGFLILIRKLKLEEYARIISRLKIKANMDIAEKRKPQDGKLYMEYKNKIYNCRLSTIPIIYGEKLVIRIMYKEKLHSTLSELNFTKIQEQNLKKIISAKNGLVIINGPTGSGKSTTLYNILNTIKKDEINITTLEDPIEIEVEGINQINLNASLGMTFANGLRSILRQDPDAIMLGEIRDEETAKMSVRAAITGHKVFATLHTKSPREVYLRLEEMGVENYLIRDALVGILSQRLIKVLCEKCKVKNKEKMINHNLIDTFRRNGCNNCNWTGYKGMTLVASVNFIDKEIKSTLKNLYNDEGILSNNEMVKVLEELLTQGKIDYCDYLDFIDGEELK